MFPTDVVVVAGARTPTACIGDGQGIAMIVEVLGN